MKQAICMVEYEQFGSKWGFTALFNDWSISCSGYPSKSAAKAAFEHLKLKKLGEQDEKRSFCKSR